jgi:hypothetical protein
LLKALSEAPSDRDTLMDGITMENPIQHNPPRASCFGLLTLGAMAVVPGCAFTPVLVTERHVAVGLWSLERSHPVTGATHEKVRGVGFGVIDGRVVLGYRQQETLTVCDHQASFEFSRPWIHTFVGDASTTNATDLAVPLTGDKP